LGGYVIVDTERGHRAGARCGVCPACACPIGAGCRALSTAPRSPVRQDTRPFVSLDDRFSARRGTYRIIYRIDVTVVDVGHRRDVCRT